MMVKTEPKSNSENSGSLVSEFKLGMMEKPDVAVQDQPLEEEIIDLCLPPLLVEAFQSGLEEEFKECNCDRDEGHNCTQPASSSDHHDCGGCNHHG